MSNCALAPPKWSSLETVLNEIKEDIQKDQQIDQPPILVLASTESTCAQLIDLVKFGQQKFNWLRTQRFSELESKPFNVPEPENKPIWSPDLVALYDEQVLEMVNFYISYQFIIFTGQKAAY
jgi:hypothetical protein